MPTLANSRHEAFAQARFRGLAVMDAYRTAGYGGSSPQVASSVSQHPEVKARLLDLHNAAGSVVAYEIADAIRDLVGVIKARPCEAGRENPLCHAHATKNGESYRFPSKLRAMARLIRIMGWADTGKPREATEEIPDRSRLIGARISAASRSPYVYDPVAAANRDPDEVNDLATLDEQKARDLAAASADPATPLTPRQEAFAQARARGHGVMKSYQIAGYFGHSGKCASRVNLRAAVQARIAELRQLVQAALPEDSYQRHHAANDLITIIQARPSEATAEHPLCETRFGPHDPYYRFPCKLYAITLLARLMHWNPGQKALPQEPPDGLDSWDRFIDEMSERAARERKEQQERENQSSELEARSE